MRNVAPKWRMSGTVPDAEKRLRIEIGIPAFTADAQPVNSEAAWKNGSGA